MRGILRQARVISRGLFHIARNRVRMRVGLPAARFPNMAFWEVALVDHIIDIVSPEACLEYGAGYSTLHFGARAAPATWDAIEHDRSWYDRISTGARDIPSIRLHLVPPSTATWEGDGSPQEFGEYIRYPATLRDRYDLVIVDGRARIGCMEAAYRLISHGGVMVLHDANRREYSTEAFGYVIPFLTRNRTARGLKIIARSPAPLRSLDIPTFDSLRRFYIRNLESRYLTPSEQTPAE